MRRKARPRPIAGHRRALQSPATLAPKSLVLSHLRPVGGGKNSLVPAAAAEAVCSAAQGLSRPASECRAGRSAAGVCQGVKGHGVGGNELRLSLLVFLTEQVGMCTSV